MGHDQAFHRWRHLIQVARGLASADLVLSGARVLNVFTQQLIRADVAICDGVIAGVGRYPEAKQRLDRTGNIIAPSFIDAHMHIESSMLWVPEFARAVVPHGTGAVIADPHEIANVAGMAGVEAMRFAAQNQPLEIRWTAPSCVPASPHESPGSTFGVDDIREMLTWSETAGLGEMMNFPAVLSGEREIFDKLKAADGHPRDGHGPGLTGRSAQAYAAAGIGSDHESTGIEEAQAKLEAGMMLMLREGSSEKNVVDLLPLVADATWRRCCFASDDRDAHDLVTKGHVDDILRTAVAAGLNPIRALTMASWNAAQYWRLGHLGAIAPGFNANFVVLDNDLESLSVLETWYQGELMASEGTLTSDRPPADPPFELTRSVRLAPLHLSHLRLSADRAKHAVEVIPSQIVTRSVGITAKQQDGFAVQDPTGDLSKLVCVERHHATGRVGVGMVAGFGLQRGAMAGSIAHDAHNILAVGTNDVDMLTAIATVADMQGGLAVVCAGTVLASLPLPVAGLMSDQPFETVARDYRAVEDAAIQLGCTLASPFGQLAFLALSVIPEARVTDRGFLEVQ